MATTCPSGSWPGNNLGRRFSAHMPSHTLQQCDGATSPGHASVHGIHTERTWRVVTSHASAVCSCATCRSTRCSSAMMQHYVGMRQDMGYTHSGLENRDEPPVRYRCLRKKLRHPWEMMFPPPPSPLHVNVGKIRVQSAPACEKNFAWRARPPEAFPTLRSGGRRGDHGTRVCTPSKRSFFRRHRSRGSAS